MEYKKLYIRETFFPSFPKKILENINWNIDQYTRKAPNLTDHYMWSDDFNQEINEWSQKNVIPGIYYAFQIAFKDLPLHKDSASTVKLIYVLDSGGDDVYTSFYSEDQKTLLHSIKVESNKWYILKTDIWHGVTGIIRPRFSICSTIFYKENSN